MIQGYTRETLDSGENHITADNGIDQTLPVTEKPFMIIYVPEKKNFHAVKTLDDIGEEFELQEVVI